ncbi:Phytochrome-like protein cph1 [Fibrisoma limi BUZ 3]|uniref:histidine kinase n=1 Tax=Fibrisoma limi BUZ 3 TaxID=1185876 RepID=I2GIT9_9BACT|nr:ATP-binding protein [Fibrisoma limi]CCH53814.1 Phytochrome-like protein cph1 [Fibrisoma limi BUZ 3]
MNPVFPSPSLPLADVLNASLNGVILLQPILHTDGSVVDFTFAFINERALAQPGLLKGWQAGMTLRHWYAVKGRAGLLDQYVAVYQTGHPLYISDYQLDENEWYEMTVARVGGQLMITFHDVTQANRALRQVQRQRDLLQAMLDTSPAGIVLYEAIRNEEGRIIDFRYVLTNPANARVIDRSVAEMTGQPLSAVLPSAYYGDFFQVLAEVTESGVSQQFTFPFEGDGVQGWFEATFVRQGDGVLFTFLDITALKESEQQQEQQARLLQTVMDVSQTAISLYRVVRERSPDGNPGPIRNFRLVLSNQQAQLSWGLPTEQFQHLTAVRPRPDDSGSDVVLDRFIRVVETGRPETWEAHSPVDDRWHKVLVAKADDGVVVASVDITESHLYQQRLEAANAALNRLNEKLQRFSAVASHDLQEPLRKVKFYGDMLLHDHALVLDDEGVSLLKVMREAAERMQRLIDNLLFYARLEAGLVNVEAVDLQAVVSQVVDDLSLNMQGATIDVGPLPVVNGDCIQLGQLFQNLFTNALKYRRPEVPLLLQVRADRVASDQLPQPPPQPIGSASGVFWRIVLTDNGVGFDPQFADRIFQSFQRLPGRTSGTGLGLAIGRQVAENHGGLLTATGRPNQGATFTLYLPASAELDQAG